MSIGGPHEVLPPHGFVDLAFEEDDGWVLMDYKTDRVAEDVTPVATRYERQIGAYQEAIGASGVAVKGAGLWFSATGAVWFPSA